MGERKLYVLSSTIVHILDLKVKKKIFLKLYLPIINKNYVFTKFKGLN